MQTSTTAYGTVLVSGDVTKVVRVTISWPSTVPAAYQTLSDLTVLSCQPVRETQTDMPDGTQYVTGYASATCDLTLAGTLDRTDATKTIAWLMGQYQSTSPMFRTDCLGLEVDLDFGVLTGDASLTTEAFEGVEFQRVMTGVIDDYTVDFEAGTVDITLLDKRADLYGTASLPSLTYVTDNDVPRADTAIDMLLRPSFLTWPTVRAKCLLAVGLRGMLHPEVGSLFSVDTTPVFDGFHFGNTAISFPAGFYGPGLQTAGTVLYDLASSTTSADIFIEALVAEQSAAPLAASIAVGTDNLSTGTADVSLTVDIHDSSVNVLATDAAGNTTQITGSTASFTSAYVAVAVNWTGSTATATIRVNGSTLTTTTSFLTGTAAARGSNPFTRVQPLSAAWALAGVQVTTEASGAAWNDGFTPTAVIDSSLNYLTAFPDVTGQDPWQVVQDIAAAELGVAGMDELGIFRFRNRDTINDAASVRTIDADTGLISLKVQNRRAAFANHVQIPVNALSVGPPAFVWAASDVIAVPASGAWEQIVSTTDPVVSLATTDSGEQPNGGGTPGNTYWRACQTADGTGARISSGIAVACSQISPAVIKITVTNTNPYIAYLVSPAGTLYPDASDGLPDLNVGGRLITATTAAIDSTVQTGNGLVADAQIRPSIVARGETLLQLAATPWRQAVPVCDDLAQEIVRSAYRAIPTWDVTAVLDPRLQRGDRITISDPDGSGIVAEDAIIQNISINDDWTMTLTVRAAWPAGAWILGVAGRSELGVTTWV